MILNEEEYEDDCTAFVDDGGNETGDDGKYW